MSALMSSLCIGACIYIHVCHEISLTRCGRTLGRRAFILGSWLIQKRSRDTRCNRSKATFSQRAVSGESALAALSAASRPTCILCWAGLHYFPQRGWQRGDGQFYFERVSVRHRAVCCGRRRSRAENYIIISYVDDRATNGDSPLTARCENDA